MNKKKKRNVTRGKQEKLTKEELRTRVDKHEGYNSKEDKGAKNDTTYKHWNDASWYIPDENLRRIVGSISYQSTLGVPTELNSYAYADGGAQYDSNTSSFEPINVMSIVTFPYPGSDISVTGSPVQGGPLTIGMRKLFAAISALTGRSQSYTPEDLGFAIMAIGDLVSGIAFAQRLLGIMFTYNPRNRGIPRVLVEAMGIQFDSLNENITRFRDSLNLIITSANNIRMVKDIKYFTKCWELYSHIYEDSQSGMAQYYVTRPAGFLELDETPDPGTGQIETKLVFHQFAVDGTLTPYSVLLRRLESMVNALLTSTTLKDVYNDILNYVNKQGGDLLGFSYVPELYSILPEYNETFLNQVHNMSWGFTDLSNYEITGDPLNTSLVTSDIWANVATDDAKELMLFTGDQILDMLFTDHPTFDDTIDACMFKTIVRDILVPESGSPKPRSWAMPDHPVHKVILYSANGTRSLFTYNTLYPSIIDRFAQACTFRALPIFYRIADESGTYNSRLPRTADFNYYTKIDYAKLKGIFDYAFLGLFDAEVKGVAPF